MLDLRLGDLRLDDLRFGDLCFGEEGEVGAGADLRLGADRRLRGDFDLRFGDLAPPRRLERNPSIIIVFIQYSNIIFF